MTLDQVAPDAMRLPVKDRAILAASLWESIHDPYTVPVDLRDEDAIALAFVRDAEIESGEVKTISHDELMARLRA